jgi:hypothetical protein
VGSGTPFAHGPAQVVEFQDQRAGSAIIFPECRHPGMKPRFSTPYSGINDAMLAPNAVTTANIVGGGLSQAAIIEGVSEISTFRAAE